MPQRTCAGWPPQGGGKVPRACEIAQLDGFPRLHAARHIRQPHAGKASLAFHAHSAVSSRLKAQQAPFPPGAGRGAGFIQLHQQALFQKGVHYLHCGGEAHARVPGDLRAAHLAALTQQVEHEAAVFSLEIIRKIWFHTASRALQRAQISKKL